jgi:hypothetical protein
MAKTKISEWSTTPASNTDIDGINIAEGCAPSGINDAIRDLMAQVRSWQSGASGDPFNGPMNGTIGATTAYSGAFTTVSATGVITSTLATGTAPLTIASTTKVTNLNADLLDGADWASPAALGSTTPAAVSATTLSASSTLSVTGAGTIQGLTVGRGAGAVATNTAVGASALAANTSGAFNVAVGRLALTANTTGQQNSALGNGAMYTNTTGGYNSGFGEEALALNTTGSYNTAHGHSALLNNTTASYSTAVGYQAGYSAVTADYNTFIGYYAGRSTTGDQNTFIGKFAGNAITSGATNTIVGAYNGNQQGLDIRTASNYTVISDGGGTPHLAAYANGTVALQGAVPVAGTGITFPATQSASSNANTLDDYEEGTWTPNFQNNGSTSNWSSKVGRYVKIGQQVTVWFYNGGGGSSNGGSGSGAVILNNLPFALTYGATLANQQAITVSGGSNTNQPGLDWLSTNGGTGTGAQVVYNAAGNQEQGNLTYVSGVWTYLTST